MNRSILITGVAGSGKSTACRELRRRGYAAHDIENIPGLFAFVDKSTGKPVVDYGDNPEWFERHSWMCDKEKLEKLVFTSHDGSAFYCGIAANLDDLLFLFDKVFLLKASAKTLRKRLSERRPDDFGRAPAIQEWLLSWKEGWEDQMRQRGATVIDADQDISEVIDEIVGLATNYKRGTGN
jgi:dephospho-CoA kinase